MSALSPENRAAIRAARQFPGQPLELLDWQDLGGQRARISGAERLHLTSSGLPHGWRLHFFAKDTTAAARSWLVTAIVVLAAGLLLIIAQVQRARRISTALERSEREEAQLRDANARLAVEIEVRRTAEQRLQRTRDELERASRLAALGQLAASVTHELGQPIAAMRNQLAAAEIAGGGNGKLTGRLSGMVERMEGITRQLKFFARPGREEFTDVDLGAAAAAAQALVAPNAEDAGAKVTLARPERPVLVRGSRLRLEQVFTNLMRNGLDAAEGEDDPALAVTIGASDGEAWVEIRDNGHGLGDTTLAELQEPFVTTRASGRGMGLGLAISAGIVADHGGQMTARNRTSGGAVFRVSFPPAPDAEDSSA
jgi:two-component system C4-dicarboxylate transport sensor histidine kinase DctB